MHYNNQSSINRRKILKLATIGSLGFFLSQCGFSVGSSIKISKGVLPFFFKFMETVSTSVTGLFVYDFLKEYNPNDLLYQQIIAINKIMAQGGFKDLSKSEVYRCNNQICYAVPHENRVGGCISYFRY